MSSATPKRKTARVPASSGPTKKHMRIVEIDRDQLCDLCRYASDTIPVNSSHMRVVWNNCHKAQNLEYEECGACGASACFLDKQSLVLCGGAPRDKRVRDCKTYLCADGCGAFCEHGTCDALVCISCTWCANCDLAYCASHLNKSGLCSDCADPEVSTPQISD